MAYILWYAGYINHPQNTHLHVYLPSVHSEMRETQGLGIWGVCKLIEAIGSDWFL